MNQMELSIISVLTGIWSKLVLLFSSVWGIISSLVLVIISYFAGLQAMFVVLGVIILTDMCVGLLAAYKSKKPITSDKLRNTVTKSGVYLLILTLTYALESTIGIGTFATKTIFGISSSVELYSVAANLLILAPNMPILRFFKFLVTGEIAKKLGISKDKVEEVLDEEN